MSNRALLSAFALSWIFAISSAPAQDVHPHCPIEPRVTSLRFTIGAGGDDLRGGSDNVTASLRFLGTGWIAIPERGGLNHGARLADWTFHIADVSFPTSGCGVSPSSISGIQLQTHFGGGMGGDNWNLQSIRVEWRGIGVGGVPASGVLAGPPAAARSSWLHRFTASDTTYDVPMTH